MPKGGSRTNSGPPPDPNALRRDRKGDAEWTTLPARREGDAPEWPLTELSERESVIWESYWRKPQAILWQHNGQEFEVALHVRQLAEAESREATTAARTLIRQQLDSLLLTLPAMRSARVRIASDEVQEKRDTRTTKKAASSRSRLKVASSGDA